MSSKNVVIWNKTHLVIFDRILLCTAGLISVESLSFVIISITAKNERHNSCVQVRNEELVRILRF